MKVYVGADHRGFNLKARIIGLLRGLGYEVIDCGAVDLVEDDDYVDYAVLTASHVVSESSGKDAKGIVICGSGMGVNVAANKINGARCGLGFTVEQVKSGRADDDINLLALAADFSDEGYVMEMVKSFVETEFKNEEKYARRLQKLRSLV